MSADTLPDARPGRSRARAAAAVALTLAVLAGAAAPIWRFSKTSVYDDPSGYVLAHAAAATALACLAALPHTTPHLGAILAATTLPGGAALYLFGVLTFVDATSGIHTSADSWTWIVPFWCVAVRRRVCRGCRRRRRRVV